MIQTKMGIKRIKWYLKGGNVMGYTREVVLAYAGDVHVIWKHREGSSIWNVAKD